MMHQLASFGTLACVVLLAWFAAAWIRALEVDRGAYHVLHGPDDGCAECEDK